MRKLLIALAFGGVLTLGASQEVRADPPRLTFDCVTKDGAVIAIFIFDPYHMDAGVRLCKEKGGDHITNVRPAR